jgi:AcrR family transcriptional regulator
MENTAKPVQARSQRTREKILQSAIEMYAKKGYHSTTVDEIAAEAGVSTGIAYRYFRNKKDMLLSAINYGVDNIGHIAKIDDIASPEAITDIQQYLETVMLRFEELHIQNRAIHDELEGLRHTDEDVKRLYTGMILEKMDALIERLKLIIKDNDNIREKAYAAIGIMEQHCHMVMDNELYELDIDIMRKYTIYSVMNILSI